MKIKRVFSILASVIVILVFSTVTMAASGATNKTPLFSKVQPGGVFVISDETDGVGNIWFVDSGATQASDAAGYGRNPDAPFATIDYAIGQASASNGDRIFVAPGHAENIATPNAINIDVAGVRIIGQGVGRNRPVITWSGLSAYIGVDTANAALENVVLDLSATSQVAVGSGVSFNVNATDFEFLNNEVIVSEAGGGAATRALNFWSGGTRTLVQGNKFIGDLIYSESAVTEVITISANAIHDLHIIDNYIQAYSTAALINGNSTSVSGFLLKGTDIFQANDAGSKSLAFSLGDNCVGVVLDTIAVYTSGVTYTTGVICSIDGY